MATSIHGFRSLALCVLISLVIAGCGKSGVTKSVDTTSLRQVPQIDVAVITVIPAEFEAMLAHMDRVYPLPAPAGYVNTFAWTGAELDRPGQDRPLRLVIALAGEAGTTSGALAALQTVEAWKPDVLVLAGIAGGLPPAVKRGDVLISSAVWGYEYGAVSDRFEPRLDWLFRSDVELVRAASDFAGQWQDDIRAEKPDPAISPRQLTGVTGSGNKVVETLDSDYVASVIARYPGIASIEMEGAGAFAAAKLMQERPEALRVVMFRGISDIPNPHSGTLGDKQDRERWKLYASDSVAAFTAAFLRDALPTRQAASARESDVLLVTYSGSTYRSLGSLSGADASNEREGITRVRISRLTGEGDLNVVIRHLLDRGSVRELEDSLLQFKPAAVLLVDTAMGIGATRIGDVETARIVWPFDVVDGTIQPHYANAWRGSRALVVAAEAIESSWQTEGSTGLKLKTGTIAAGTDIPEWDDADAIAEISALNPRTAMIDDDSLLVADAVMGRIGAPHFLSIQAAARVAGLPDSDEELAGRHAASVVLALMQKRWPYASVNP